MAEPMVAASIVAEPQDFSGLVASEQKRIFLICLRILQDPDEADSAAQDVFLKAYRSMQTAKVRIDEPARWLTRIAVNTCLDRLRSQRYKFWRKRPAPNDEVLILTMAESVGPTAEDKIFALQIQRRLFHALNRLSDRQRAVFTLKHFEDRSLEEIAGILDLDIGTVKAHMARAVAKLREELRDLYKGTARKVTI